MKVVGFIWRNLHRNFWTQFLTIFFLTTFLIVYPLLVNYAIFDETVKRAEIRPTFTEYVSKTINIKNPKTFVVTNAVSLIRFHCNNIFWFSGSLISWLIDKQTNFQTFIVYHCFIYYTLMIFAWVFSIATLIKYHCDPWEYPSLSHWMDKWYIRWFVNFMIFMLLVNTISFIIALFVMHKSKKDD